MKTARRPDRRLHVALFRANNRPLYYDARWACERLAKRFRGSVYVRPCTPEEVTP